MSSSSTDASAPTWLTHTFTGLEMAQRPASQADRPANEPIGVFGRCDKHVVIAATFLAVCTFITRLLTQRQLALLPLLKLLQLHPFCCCLLMRQPVLLQLLTGHPVVQPFSPSHYRSSSWWVRQSRSADFYTTTFLIYWWGSWLVSPCSHICVCVCVWQSAGRLVGC